MISWDGFWQVKLKRGFGFVLNWIIQDWSSCNGESWKVKRHCWCNNKNWSKYIPTYENEKEKKKPKIVIYQKIFIYLEEIITSRAHEKEKYLSKHIIIAKINHIVDKSFPKKGDSVCIDRFDLVLCIIDLVYWFSIFKYANPITNQ